MSYPQRTHRVAMATFKRTFHHDGLYNKLNNITVKTNDILTECTQSGNGHFLAYIPS
jgi:hypothetical protein